VGGAAGSRVRRVAIVSPYPAPGERSPRGSGILSYTRGLAEALARHYEVFVVADALPGVPREYVEGGVTVVRAFRPDPLYPLRAAEELRRIGPDVVHVQHSYFLYGGLLEGAIFPALLAASRPIARVVVTMHDLPSLRQLGSPEFLRMNGIRGPGPVLRAGVVALNRAIASLADAVIVHEEFLREVAVRDYRMPPGKVVVRPHGAARIALEDRARARGELGVGDGRTLVLFYGYLSRYKGLDVLLRALEGGLLEGRYSLIIAGGPHPRAPGDPGYRAWLSGLLGRVRELRARGADVRITGFVRDPAPYLSAADVVVLPYLERFSASGPAAAASANGVPVLLAEPGVDGGELERRIVEFVESRGAAGGRAPAPLWEEVAEGYYSFLESPG
jgi:glycosyltransferase involved in cell wall biosynthesis